jgi:hypothetical protein
VDGVGGDATTGAAAFAAADDGTLVYAAGGAGVNGSRRVLVWADRTGAIEPIDLQPAFYNDQRVSPDGSRFAVIVGASGSGDVWIFDVARKTFTRLTFDRNAATPVWSTDGRNVFYAAVDPRAHTSFYRKPVDGSRERERVGDVTGRSLLQSLNRAGDSLLFMTAGGVNRLGDIIAMSLHDGRQTPIVATDADEFSGALSPDSHRLAYQSNESGRYEVYVTDRTGSGGRWQISTADGEEPHWSADGSGIFYRADDRLMHVAVVSREPFRRRRAGEAVRRHLQPAVGHRRELGRGSRDRPVSDDAAGRHHGVCTGVVAEGRAELVRRSAARARAEPMTIAQARALASDDAAPGRRPERADYRATAAVSSCAFAR